MPSTGPSGSQRTTVRSGRREWPPALVAGVLVCCGGLMVLSCARGGFDRAYADQASSAGGDSDTGCSEATRFDQLGSGVASDPYLICTAQQLSSIGDPNDTSGLDKYYLLVNDLDLSGYDETSINLVGKKHHAIDNWFAGTFDGNHKTIANLRYNTPGDPYIALFPYLVGDGVIDGVNDGHVARLRLSGFDLTTQNASGSLAGLATDALIEDCSVSGAIAGGWKIGGLVGEATGSTRILRSRSDVTIASVTGGDTGGLVGVATDTVEVGFSFAVGNVTGEFGVGGLLGHCISGALHDVYARGTVGGDDNNHGGLVGYNDGCTVTNAYEVGAVSGANWTGGLVGWPVAGSYGATIWNTTNNASLPATGTGGGTSVAGVVGHTDAEMKVRSTFESLSWDFVSVWTINEGTDYPTLIGVPSF